MTNVLFFNKKSTRTKLAEWLSEESFGDSIYPQIPNDCKEKSWEVGNRKCLVLFQ